MKRLAHKMVPEFQLVIGYKREEKETGLVGNKDLVDNPESYRKGHTGPCRRGPHPKSTESLSPVKAGSHSQVHISEKCKDTYLKR